MKQYPQHMKMSELSACTKISVDTIRNYIRKGLLPKPIKTGKTMAYYTIEHVDNVKKINALQKKGYSLDEIKKMVNRQSRDTHSGLKSDKLYTSKRNAIVKAAADLFRDNGYKNVKIDDIVAHAGIGKSTFYQYFRSMEKLFFECTQYVFFDITRNYPGVINESDGIKRLWNRAHTFWHTHSHLIDMLNLIRGIIVKDSNWPRKNLEKDVMHNLINPIHADLIQASQQQKFHFEDLNLLAYLMMGSTEYFYYYLQTHPEVDIDNAFIKSWDIGFNPLIHVGTKPEIKKFLTYTLASAVNSAKMPLQKTNENDHMKISDLSKSSGISISTIRYYILAGLLPAAEKTGKTRAYYSSIHLNALNLIRHKQNDEKKPLNVIREEIEKEVSFPKKTVKPSSLSFDKREAILLASTSLFLKKGYIKTSTADIAHHAKISKETVYKYFGNKEEIFMSCSDRIFHDMYNHIWNEIKEERDPVMRMAKRTSAFFSSYPQWISMMNLMRGLSVGDNPSFRHKFHQIIKQMIKPIIRQIEYLKQEGCLSKDIDSDITAFALMGATEYGAWLIHHEHYSEETIMEALNTYLYEGIIIGPS